jgi:leader peptidase (prepilin peptidase) / N-methyltransferase
MFDAQTWAAVPFHFWSVVFFLLGSMVGSLLNVCIHRMPRGQSILFPSSHCPHCQYSIPWYLNVPLFTWAMLRGKCANCAAPIAARYFLVELLTGLVFLGVWLMYGPQSVPLALVYCLFMAGLIVATFIDFEHFIIPDEITLGGIVAGFMFSAAWPALHQTTERTAALGQSFLGIAVGGGLLYAIVRGGKLLFGRQKFLLEPGSKIVFTETCLQLPEQEIPYEEMFYRKSDVLALQARTVELADRCYLNVEVRLSPEELRIGEERFNPAEVERMEIVTDELVIPREAMGFGDVKFMAAIGAFLGWPAVLFSLVVSSLLGSVVGLSLIALKRRQKSNPIPFGPYIAAAAALWVFGGYKAVDFWFS